MPPYLQLGSLPRKRHIAHRHEPGYRGEGIYYEEVVTTAGFGRAYSIVYHLRPPTRVRKVEPAGTVPLELVDGAGPAPPSPQDRRNLPPAGDPITGRVPLLANDDVTIGRCRPAQPQAELYRNATADEVIFVHRGQGDAAHDVRPAARSGPSTTSSSRAARRTGSSSTPASRARPAGDRGGRQRRASRRST